MNGRQVYGQMSKSDFFFFLKAINLVWLVVMSPASTTGNVESNQLRGKDVKRKTLS